MSNTPARYWDAASFIAWLKDEAGRQPACEGWLNLAKAGSTEPLAFGLHGTGIPAQMSKQQGIGGLRLTNWDIARAVRLMPAGTALQWKRG